MEILLIACMLAYVAGAQSEQSKLGLSPAQRDVMRENTRHEKAVQRIADKHGVKPPHSRKAGLSPWKEAPDTDGEPELVVPDTFRSGYHSRRPATPPFGHRVGVRAGAGVTWVQDTGRDAWHAYRERRRKASDDDPKPVPAPVTEAHPPNAPPMPDKPPTVGAPEGEAERVEPDGGETPTAKPDGTVETKPDLIKAEPEGVDEPKPQTPDAEPEPVVQQPNETPAATPGGTGRMAAEVTYESVMDESDELSLMCEDDVRVYGRIRERAEREISRGDELIAKMEAAGFGPKVIGWVSRCKEQYQVIHSQLDDLEQNTIAQREAVVKAKALLLSGQGVYADIAKDMESVADRDSYVSDAVDAEDTQANTEIYETKAA